MQTLKTEGAQRKGEGNRIPVGGEEEETQRVPNIVSRAGFTFLFHCTGVS